MTRSASCCSTPSWTPCRGALALATFRPLGTQSLANSENLMAKIGRPKGSKNKPKWLKVAIALNKPKRGRGRPKGSKNKPKTIPDLVAQALAENVVAPKVPEPKPKQHVGRKGGNPTLNAVPPEVRSERARKAALAGIEKRKA